MLYIIKMELLQKLKVLKLKEEENYKLLNNFKWIFFLNF